MADPPDDAHARRADGGRGADGTDGDTGGDGDSAPGPGSEAPAPTGGPGSGTGAPDERGPGGLDRRTLIRLLVGLGIGVPLLVEGATLLGLVGGLFGGDGEATTTPTATTDAGVGVGDELLPDTPPAETVRAAYVAADGWTFTLAVAVENTGDRTYDLRLRAVTTDGGETVEGGGATGPIPPGESGSVTGRWDLPNGASPVAVDVVAVARNGTVTPVERTVELGSVPVQSG